MNEKNQMNISSFLANDTLRLRALEPEDLEIMYSIENNPELWQINTTTAPYSRYVLRRYLENSRCDIFADGELRLVIERQCDGQVLGCTELVNFDFLHHRAEVGIVVLADYRGEGIGSQVLRLLVRYAFEYLHLHQLYAHVAADNLSCLSMFVSCGFCHESCLPDWLCVGDGQFRDVKLLHCLASDVRD